MAKIRVLLAEDHETIREGLRLIINAQPDMEVVGEARNGEVAVSAARELRPDVVVMDVSMPNMTGLTATERLAECCPDVKVLTLTRHGDEPYVQQLLRAGAAGYVLKQSQSSELLNGIRAVAAGQKYLDPAVTAKVVREYARKPLPASSAPVALSGREEEVVRLVAWGYSNKEIAARLELSVKTVETHKSNAMSKLGLRNRTEVVRYALVRGWLSER